MLPSSKKTRLYETIVAQLGQLIQEGKLCPGDRLPPERELAARLQVSRASVREALRSLELQGLLSSRQGSGTFIAAVSQEELLRAFARLAEEGQTLRDIFELRLLLEPPIAALAARRRSGYGLPRGAGGGHPQWGAAASGRHPHGGAGSEPGRPPPDLRAF